VSHEYWYISRAAGFTAYLLLFVSVVLGIANGTRFADRFFRRNNVFDMHRFTALLSLFFVAFHVFILLGDGYFSIGLKQLLVPLTSPYRPWQVAVGILSFYSLVLIIVSFYVRKFIGYRAWRAIHFLTFALFAGATLHGIVSGTDTNVLWAKVIYIGCGSAVVLLTFYRVQYRIPDDSAAAPIRRSANVVWSAEGAMSRNIGSRSTNPACVIAMYQSPACRVSAEPFDPSTIACRASTISGCSVIIPSSQLCRNFTRTVSMRLISRSTSTFHAML